MISICIATYNGAPFIIRQIDSVLQQVSSNDEIIVVDDRSSDQTVSLLKQKYGPRLTILVNEENQGPIKSFEKAIGKATGDYLFLCDQDDIWEPNKVERVMRCFLEEQAKVVVHDAYVVDKDLKMIDPSWNHYNRNSKKGLIGNVIKNSFTGACMAMHKDVKTYILPFPTSIEMHDQWIALAAMRKGQIVSYIDEPLLKYVRHGGNVTGMKKRSLAQKLKGRLGTITALLQLKS